MKSTSTTNSRAKSKAKEVGVDFRKGSTSDVIFIYFPPNCVFTRATEFAEKEKLLVV